MAAWRWRKLLLKKVATMRLQKPEVVLCCRRESKRLAMMKRRGAEPRCSGLGDEGRRAALRRGEMNATTKVSMRRQMSKRVGPRVEPSPWLGREPSSIKTPKLADLGLLVRSQKSPDRKAAKTSGQSPPVGSRDWERRQPCRASHAATLPPLPPSGERPPIPHPSANLPLGGFMDTISTSVHVERCPRPPHLNKQNHYIRQIRLPSHEHSNSRPCPPRPRLVHPSRETR